MAGTKCSSMTPSWIEIHVGSIRACWWLWPLWGLETSAVIFATACWCPCAFHNGWARTGYVRVSSTVARSLSMRGVCLTYAFARWLYVWNHAVELMAVLQGDSRALGAECGRSVTHSVNLNITTTAFDTPPRTPYASNTSSSNFLDHVSSVFNCGFA